MAYYGDPNWFQAATVSSNSIAIGKNAQSWSSNSIVIGASAFADPITSYRVFETDVGSLRPGDAFTHPDLPDQLLIFLGVRYDPDAYQSNKVIDVYSPDGPIMMPVVGHNYSNWVSTRDLGDPKKIKIVSRMK